MRRILRFFSFCMPIFTLGLVSCAAPGTLMVMTSATSGTTTESAPAVLPSSDSRRVLLAGNVHPLARPEFAIGPVARNARLDRMVMLLKRSEARQRELDELVDAQQDASSDLFQQWLTPEEFGARFGADVSDVERVKDWLQAQGFTIDDVPAGGGLIVFSGSAGTVAHSFGTEVDRFRVAGVEHIANSANLQIPAELAGAISGVVSLHDFRREAQVAERTPLMSQPQFSAGNTHYIFPADFWTVYDLNPLF
jgi:subtilase family serine protease